MKRKRQDDENEDTNNKTNKQSSNNIQEIHQELLSTQTVNSQWVQRKQLIESLGRLVVQYDELIINTLLKYLKDKKAPVRVSVATALGEISSNNVTTNFEPILERLFQLLPNYDGTCHSIGYAFERVLIGGGTIDNNNKWNTIINRVITIMNETENIHVRRCCIEILGGAMIASPSKDTEILEHIIPYINNNDNELIRMSASDVLGKAQRGNEVALEHLIDRIQNEKVTSVLVKVIDAVGRIVPDNKTSIIKQHLEELKKSTSDKLVLKALNKQSV
jgi:HEAT repeat protein